MEQPIYIIVIRDYRGEVVCQSLYTDERLAWQDFETDRVKNRTRGTLCGPFHLEEGFDVSSSLRGDKLIDEFDNM